MLSPVVDPTLLEPAAKPVNPTLDLIDRPVLAVAYLLAGGLMEICGPLFWGVLMGGFVLAQFCLD